jgi:hypothetical protein
MSSTIAHTLCLDLAAYTRVAMLGRTRVASFYFQLSKILWLKTDYLFSYVTSDDCSQSYTYVCETAPYSVPPDYPCPGGFYPFKGNCLSPFGMAVDYDTAVVSPIVIIKF